MSIHRALRAVFIICLCATQIHMYFPWKGVPRAGTCKAQRTRLFRSPLRYHWYLPTLDFADLWRRDLQCPIPVGASLGLVYRSTILLRIIWALTSHSFLQVFKTYVAFLTLDYHSKVIVVHFISMQLFQLYSVVLN